MRTLVAWAFIFVGGTLLLPSSARAQDPARTDSLEAQVRRLRAQLDSLQRVLEELIRSGRDTTSASDELARLRAAALAAARQAEVPDSNQESRTRDLSILNPEISLTADVVGNYVAPAGERNAFGIVPREFEFSFQAAVDSYTRTKVFITYEEGFEIAGLEDNQDGTEAAEPAVRIEEGYLQWVGLPGAFGIKAGKFRQDIGLYNRWHTHALFEVDRPLAATTFLGEDGLIHTGASLTFPSFMAGPATQTLTAQATLGNNDALFDGGSNLSYLARLQSFWEVGDASTFQLGATGVFGKNNDTNLKTGLLGLDFMFRWTPPRRALYRDLQIKGEWYFAERKEDGTPVHGNGGYGQISFKFTRQWIVGTRVDFLTPYQDTDLKVVQIVPSLTWWQSEYVRFRAQYHYVKPQGLAGSHTLLLQLVWAVGPHKHENY